MIRDIRWAYELGFKRGWKVGHRRGLNANLIGAMSEISATVDSDVLPINVAISCDTESTEERKFSDLKTEVECDHD
jgi:hypothetical protein